MVNIKVEHKENVRKFTLPENASWIDLEGKLRTLFCIPLLTPFTLSYTDEDNDIITLSTDIELREIISSHPTIKFSLKFSTDDLSDSDDNSDAWVLEGGSRKSSVSATIIETDTSVLQSNVSQKNIISTTNQEPQNVENDIIDETSNKKAQVDDGFERVEKSPGGGVVERVEEPPNDIEKEEKLPSNIERIVHIERAEKSPNDIEREEKSPSNIERVVRVERVELPSGIESVVHVERVEKSTSGVERVELPSGIGSVVHAERVEKSPDDIRVEKTSTDLFVERAYDLFVERASNDLFVERASNDLFVERASNDLFVERASNDLFVERASDDLFVEKKSNDFDRVEKSLNDIGRVENSNTKISRVDLLDDEFFVENSKKISRVNLLDDEFFESFNSFKISPTIPPFDFEPKPIPQPQSQPQREVEDEQEDEETIVTLLSNNFSPLSERSQPQRQDQDSDLEGELKEVIEKYIKKDPHRAASVIDEIRSSILIDRDDQADFEKLDPFRHSAQQKEDKHNSYFRQHSITSPISGRSRSATPPRSGHDRSTTSLRSGYNRSSTPPRSGYNRSSTPPRSGYNRSSTPPRSGYNRSSTPPRSGYNRSHSPTEDYIHSSTPPILPGSFPVPASTPCLWVNEETETTPRPDSNTNQKNGRGRRGGRRRGGGYKYRRSNQRNAEHTNVEGREETPEETPEQKEYQEYREDIKQLNDMGFNESEDRYVELLIRHNRNMDLITEELLLK